MKKGFFAFSGSPKSSGQCIGEAIAKINQQRVTHLRSWRDYTVNGKLIIHDITQAIDNADYFCADLTGMSDNVLFELGYAIAKKKPIFLIFDNSIISSLNRYKELFLLTSVGYASYTNSRSIIDSFLYDKPYEQYNNNFFNNLISKIQIGNDRKSLLYLKNQIDTNYSRKISEKITEYRLSCIVDDASESPVQSLTWYLEQLHNVPAVLVEFSSVERRGYVLQNSKCSFISGLAYGLKLRLFMVAEAPYKPSIAETPYEIPIDYREFLVQYSDTETLEENISPFLYNVKDEAIEFLSSNKYLKTIANRQKNNLQNIDFGAFIAEQEDNRLSSYYLDIFDLRSLVRNNYNVVIGRKGSGKTATLYSLSDFLNDDSRNHVCLIEPVIFEIEGLLHLLETLPENYEKSYLVESTWKFLIYTEITKSLYEKINERHSSSYDETEIKFVEFVENNEDIFLCHLSERLENELLSITTNTKSISEFNIKVSEAIHENILSRVRDMLKEVLNVEERIVILIDNLDKSWSKDKKINLQSIWILGLLNATNSIVRDLSKKTIRKNKKEVQFNLTIFLRSDIFNYIRDNYTEPDKLDFTNLRWNDPEILFRVIDKRFVELNGREVMEDEFWEEYVVKKIGDEPVKNYIYSRIFPRPRDLIFFFTQALNTASRRGHALITEEDIKSAYSDYSNWLFSAILVEDNITKELQMKQFLYGFAGSSNIITKENIRSKMEEAAIPFDDNQYLNYFIDHLASISIIGREVQPEKFEFEYEFNSKDKIKALAKKIPHGRFKIHNALIPCLSLRC